MFFDPIQLLFIAPALALAYWAQMRVRSAYQRGQQIPAALSGAAAARHILDSAGLRDVAIEPIPGHLSDHYDPAANVLRLSQAVYSGRNQAAVGIAAHEAGHAIQRAVHYAPLVIRNAAVPAAGFGSNSSFLFILLGLMMGIPLLIQAGIALFAIVVVFQLVNLPVEFDASARAKRQIVALGIVPERDMGAIRAVLNAAALTYVAATLQSLLTLLYYLFRFTGQRNDD